MQRHEHLSFCLRRGGLIVHVETTDTTLRQWLQEFFAPSFTIGAPQDSESTPPHEVPDSVWTIYDVDDQDRYNTTLDAGPVNDANPIECATNDGSFVTYPLWGKNKAQTTVFFDTYRCFCTVDLKTNTIEVVHGSRRARPRIAIMRLIRELATTTRLRNGHLHLHASAYVTGGNAVAMVGPKRAGKTSTLIHATLRGGASYLTNDRLYVSFENGQLIAGSMPTIVSIRPPSFQLFPELAERYKRIGYRKETTLDEAHATYRRPANLEERALVTPAQFCDLLQASPAAPAPLSELVFPSVHPNMEKTHSVLISPKEAGELLFESVFRGSTPLRVAELFRREDETALLSELDMRRQCQTITKQVPCFRRVLGRDAYTSGHSTNQLRGAA